MEWYIINKMLVELKFENKQMKYFFKKSPSRPYNKTKTCLAMKSPTNSTDDSSQGAGNSKPITQKSGRCIEQQIKENLALLMAK